jgi:drug/metabolite transporter (DMT)-like permease
LAFVWDVLFFGRPTGLVNWFGVVIVLFAIYFAMTRQSVHDG